MRILSHVFEALSLLLHRIIRWTKAVNLNLLTLYFDSLASTLALYQCADYTDTSTSCDAFQCIGIHRSRINDNLNVVYCRTIVECNEINCLAVSMGTNPSFHVNILAIFGALQCIDNLCSFHFQCFCYSNIPLRSISTSCSVRKRQSPRLKFFFVRPANCTRSNRRTR